MIKKLVVLILVFCPIFSMDMNVEQKEAIFKGFEKFLGEVHSCQSKRLMGGLSKNKQYLYRVNDRQYVVRVLGEIFSKRHSEINIHRLAAVQKIAPKIYYYDDAYSFIIMDYVEGHTLFLEQASKHEVLDCMVEKVRRTNQLNAQPFINQDGWHLFTQINNDYNKIKHQADASLNSMIEQALSRVQAIHQTLEIQNHPLIFCHNDLNYRNIFFTEKDMLFIDWEMAGMNYPLYDLAYYSVFSCLQEADDYYVLTKYLEHTPSDIDLDYFNSIKLMIRCCNAFYILAFLEYIPTSVPMESIKNFEFYARIFSQNATAMSPEFLYAIAISQLRIFF